MQSSNGRPRSGEIGPDSPDETYERPAGAFPGVPGGLTYDDPWYDALASGWGEPVAGRTPAAVPQARREQERGEVVAGEIYLGVQRSAAFQEVRSRYRRFVVPAMAVSFSWYVGYVVAATIAPGFMARPVAGVVNVAMLAGLGQFVTTFLFTWAYARHARLRRDRAALELRWDTQELTRGVRGGMS